SRDRARVALAAIGVATLALSACGTTSEEAAPETPDDSGAADDHGGPARGGVLTMVQTTAINSWHPGAISAAQTFQRMQPVYDALLYVDDDGNLHPGTAESLESD